MTTTMGRIGRKHRLCAQCGLSPVREFGDICGGCRDAKAQRSSRQAKIEWLLEHPSIWEAFPKEGQLSHGKVIFLAMQKAGLYSSRTEWIDADIIGLISDARRVRREKAASHIKHCKGCGYPIHPSCDYCGECLCEDDCL